MTTVSSYDHRKKKCCPLPRNSVVSLDGCKQLNATAATGGSEDSTRGQFGFVHHQVKAEPLEREEQTLPALTESNVKRGHHKCTLCGKVFTRNYGLVVHMRIHTGEKPVQCHVCQMGFNQKCTLKRHLRIHTGEKPYQCHLCPMKFTIRCGLTDHLRTHTGDRPYQCHLCPSKFYLRRALSDHMNTHTGGKPFKCHLCNMAFTWRKTLCRHLKSHGVTATHQ